MVHSAVTDCFGLQVRSDAMQTVRLSLDYKQGRNQLIFSGGGKWCKLVAVLNKYIRVFNFRGAIAWLPPPLVVGLTTSRLGVENDKLS